MRFKLLRFSFLFLQLFFLIDARNFPMEEGRKKRQESEQKRSDAECWVAYNLDLPPEWNQVAEATILQSKITNM